MAIAVMNCREKLRKLSFMFFNKIWMMKDVCKNTESSQISHHFKYQIPTAWGLKTQFQIHKAEKQIFLSKFLINFELKI